MSKNQVSASTEQKGKEVLVSECRICKSMECFIHRNGANNSLRRVCRVCGNSYMLSVVEEGMYVLRDNRSTVTPVSPSADSHHNVSHVIGKVVDSLANPVPPATLDPSILDPSTLDPSTPPISAFATLSSPELASVITGSSYPVKALSVRDVLPPGFPEIITICGSSRFKDEMMEVQGKLTLKKKVVIPLGLFGHMGDIQMEELVTENRCSMCGNTCEIEPLDYPIALTRSACCKSAVTKKVYRRHSADKIRLDDLHLQKIDMSDSIFVVDPRVVVCVICKKSTRLYTELSEETECCRSRYWYKQPYIGESTMKEIAYAERLGKKVYYLVDVATGKDFDFESM